MDKTRKPWYLLLHTFWTLLPKINFWRKDRTLFWDFLLIFEFPKILCLKSFNNSWRNSYKVHYTRHLVPFYLREIKLSWKHTKLQIYYVTDCLKTFHLHSQSLIMIHIPGNRPIFWLTTEKHIKISHQLPLKPL